jgi:cytochrome c biogenesis protein CcdA
MVAKMINSLSAFASGFTMMFLYWTITRMTAKLIMETSDSRIIRSVIIIASGLAGALVCTFSDTFWYMLLQPLLRQWHSGPS